MAEPHDQEEFARRCCRWPGSGTRFLPATKAMPKEMLPLVDVPSIQLIVEECVAAGIEEIIFVTARGKSAIEDHFDRAAELEALLERRGKTGRSRAACGGRPRWRASFRCGRARRAGSGHAVLCARDAVGDEPFAVLLGDDLLDAEVPGIGQLIDVYEKTGTGVIGAQGGRRPGRSTCTASSTASATAPRELRDPQAGREARARHRAVAAGDHRALRVAAGDLRDPRRDAAGPGRRDPADRRAGDVVRAARPGRPGGRGRRFDVGDRAGLRRGDGALRAPARGHRATRCARAWRACWRRPPRRSDRDVDAGRKPGGALLEVAVALPVPGTFTYRDPAPGAGRAHRRAGGGAVRCRAP